MDVLADVLQVAGAAVRVDRCLSLGASPTVLSEKAAGGLACMVSRGKIRLMGGAGTSFDLAQGDAIFLMDGETTTARSAAGSTAAELVVGRVAFAGGRIGSGDWIGWPPILHLQADEDGGGLVGRLAVEVRAAHPGWEAVASGLAHALFVAAIRAHDATAGGCPAHGWLRGLNDPEIGMALRLMHEQPAYPWTVAGMADRLSVSRSAFAARFKQVTGRPPLTYLTWWRLCRAAAVLKRRDGTTVAQVAREVGYETEAAFGKAFRRQFGCTPGQVRREAPGAGAASPLQAELKKRDAFGVREQEVAINLMRSAARFSADGESLFSPHGINGVQYNILRILRGEGRPLPWAEIRSRLVTPSIEEPEAVSRLASDGHLEVEATGRLALSPRGAELLARLDGPIVDLHRRQLAHFSPEELAEFDRLLVKARRPDL